jgi:hypothetical protein
MSEEYTEERRAWLLSEQEKLVQKLDSLDFDRDRPAPYFLEAAAILTELHHLHERIAAGTNSRVLHVGGLKLAEQLTASAKRLMEAQNDAGATLQ